MSASRGVVFTFAVGARYVCTLALPATVQRGEVTHVAVEWSPKVPRKLSARELADYERGRDRAFAEWLQTQGGPAVDDEPGEALQ